MEYDPTGAPRARVQAATRRLHWSDAARLTGMIAAGAALAYGHRAGLARVIAVARETNGPSRALLADIGMTECGEHLYQGNRMLVFESVR